MNVELFKMDLRKIVNNNPQELKFELRFWDNRPVEFFTTKKDFGLRILELLEDNKTAAIELTILKRKGYFGKHNPHPDDYLRFTDIERLEFTVWTYEEFKKIEEKEAGMSAQEWFYYSKK